jgi:hypothetical protein
MVSRGVVAALAPRRMSADWEGTGDAKLSMLAWVCRGGVGGGVGGSAVFVGFGGGVREGQPISCS